MGVAGLWEVLRPAGKVRSITELAVHDGFSANPSRQRGFRIGIDASIWFFHAAYGREGENPELRTLFFRCCRLLQSPLLPLFVFDGPNRPAVKRGKRVGGNQHWLTQGMKNIIDAFGFEWWVAPGEAEAELAYLNRVGIIDAVLSDDVDNFLFGAVMVIRNPSNTLSGNRAHPVMNAQGKDDGNHVVTYAADIILSDPSVSLSLSGTILIGLLSGGDYIPAGLPGCGQKFATGLARAGFGDSLVKAVKKLKGPKLDAFLDEWRRDIRNELKTNKSGLLPSKKPSLAASLPDDFPSLPVLMSYADPITSENTPPKGKRKTPPRVWRNDPDPMRIAALCELYFEWGVKDVIVQRFRTVLWPGIVCRAVRRVVVDEETHRHPTPVGRHQDSGEEDDDTTSPSSPTKQISSALSALALSSPSKKSKSSASTTSTSEYFILSSLVSLTSTSPSSSSSSIPSTSSPLLLEVVSQRTHVSTDSILEYRVLVDPTALVERAESGVKGLRPPLVGGLFGIDPEDEDSDDGLDPDADESGDDAAIERLETAAGAASKSGKKKRKARREEPTTPLRLWLPACMVRAAVPALVDAYEEKMRVREEKKAKRGAKGARGGRAGKTTGDCSTSRRTKAKDVASEGGDESESVPGPCASRTVRGSKPRTKAAARVGGGGGRRRAKPASEAQNDAYEFIDLSAGESPCSESGGEGVKTSTKGRRKAKTGPTDATKPKTKTNATAAGSMKDFYKTTKSSSATRATKSKPSKASTSNPVASKPIHEEEDSTDVAAPPPLPKSYRPLDLLRAKTKSNAAASNSTSKSKSTSTAVARYEEESSSSSLPSRPSGSKTNILARPVAQARKKPLFVDVSDTDSDTEVSDVRCSLYHATGVTGTSGIEGSGPKDVSLCATKSTFRVVDGVIDLTTKGSTSGSNIPSTSIPTRPPSPVCSTSALLGTSKSTDGVSPTNSDAVLCTPTTRLASKLARVLLPRPEEEEGSEDDELPTFHRGSSAKKPSAAIARPAPRPFPMQLVSDLAVYPHASGLGGRDDDETVEIVDVFTTPRSPLPPRSPSQSPVKRPPVAAVVTSKSPSGFSDSLSESESQMDAERQARTRQRRQGSPDSDARTSGNEGNGILKSPRKSAAHSSPRHVRTREHASSPTRSPPPTCNAARASRASSGASWARCDTRGRERWAEDSGLSRASSGVGRKPRPSDASAIYISSGSEDEGDVGLGEDDGDGGGDAEVLQERDQDQDQETDADLHGDGDGWADTAMILSVPPSPARASAHDLVSDASVPDAEIVPPNPVRTSKFKPAPVAPKADVRAASARPELEREASGGGRASSRLETSDRRHVSVPRPQPVRYAPLLVARAKRCVGQRGKDADVIDLTSD